MTPTFLSTGLQLKPLLHDSEEVQESPSAWAWHFPGIPRLMLLSGMVLGWAPSQVKPSLQSELSQQGSPSRRGLLWHCIYSVGVQDLRLAHTRITVRIAKLQMSVCPGRRMAGYIPLLLLHRQHTLQYHNLCYHNHRLQQLLQMYWTKLPRVP
jgi:hypothetical protein